MNFIKKNLNFLFNKRVGKIIVAEKGLSEGLSREQSLKGFFILLIITGYIAINYEPDFKNRMLLIGVILLCFILELINTSIEAVVDRISTKKHFLSGYAKDLASTATFLFTIFTIIIWFRWLKNQWEEYKLQDKKRKINLLNFYKLPDKKKTKVNIFNEWQQLLLIIAISMFFLIPFTRFILNIFKGFAITRHI